MRLGRLQNCGAASLALIASLTLTSCLSGSTDKNPGSGGPGPNPSCGLGGTAPSGSGGFAVAAGLYHSVALKNDGTVWSWGGNQSGQLGDGTTSNCSTPISVGGLTGVVGIAAGYSHTLAVKTDGTVWAWGSNFSGQLGNGDLSLSNRSAPVQVVDTAATGFLSGIVAVAAGESHSLALKNDGTVWAWGDNSYGQLGDGTTAGQHVTPIQVSVLTNVIAIAAGGRHSIAIKTDGTVWAWGQNSGGQLGIGSADINPHSTPFQVPGLSVVSSIAAGDSHTVALDGAGNVWAWGSNSHGQLGNGDPGLNNQFSPVLVLAGVSGIAAGYSHTLVVNGNTVWAFGDNFFGQLGLGATDGNPHPTPVQVPGLTGAIKIAGGGSHSLAIKSDGTVWAWGENQNGQLGNGTSGSGNLSTTPVQVSGLVLF
ncbi:MAG: hypothetical protein HY204_03790 [Nitrospirae bacterium]|nr:hypothetical protein [Nitrospirota bacterium]